MKIEEQLNFDAVVLSHRPLNGPREGITEEEVICELWERIANESCEGHSSYFGVLKIHSVLADILLELPGTINQREATVCATFVCWLGSNNGRGFLSHAERLAKEYPNLGRDVAYGTAWLNENRRWRYINHGERIVESLLYIGEGHRARFENEDVRDHEVIEHLVYWLSGSKGQFFLKTVREEVARRRSEARRTKKESQFEHSE